MLMDVYEEKRRNAGCDIREKQWDWSTTLLI